MRDDRPWGDQTPPAVWYPYTPDRKGEHPQAHLSEFRGTSQADAYPGYEKIYKGGRVREACLREVLSRIVDHPINRIEELLPWNLTAELAGQNSRTEA